MQTADTKIDVGTKVEWTSSAAGTNLTKRGLVVAVILSKMDPRPQIRNVCETYGTKRIYGVGGFRRHESYLVIVRQRGNRKPVLYWPVVAKLKVITDSLP